MHANVSLCNAVATLTADFDWSGNQTLFCRRLFAETGVKLEKCIGRICVIDVILSKFGHDYKSCLVVLLVVNLGLQIGLHDAVLLFCLAVCLWIEGGRKSPFYA